MVRQVFTLRDLKSDFGSPFCCVNANIARRELSQVVNSEKHSPISQFPEDYDMYQIGEFNTESGELTAIDKKFICNGLEVKQAWKEVKDEKTVSSPGQFQSGKNTATHVK